MNKDKDKDKDKNLKDLRHIRELMERSLKFLSLSGFSGVSAGIFALLGAAVARFILSQEGIAGYEVCSDSVTSGILIQFTLLSGIVLGCAAGSAIYFSSRKARRLGLRLWTATSKRVFYQFLIPLATGGLFCLILAVNRNVSMVIPAMLVFYGLALVNTGKFTISEVHYLGMYEITLGIIAGFFPNYGLLFWTLGFGVLHIGYGIRIYFRYDRKDRNGRK